MKWKLDPFVWLLAAPAIVILIIGVVQAFRTG